MPFALYSTLTGVIVTVLPWKKPDDAEQLDVLAANNLAFAEVPDDITPNNSMVDLGTGAAVPRGPARTYKTRVQYDPDTGVLGGYHSAAFVADDPLLALPNQIVVDGGLPAELQDGMILTLDDSKQPVKDDQQKYVSVVPEPITPPPTKEDLLLLAAVRAGTLDAAEIPTDVLDKTNAALAVAGIAAIEVK